MNIETKKYFDGADIELLPKDKLLECIDCLFNELESARRTAKSIIELNKLMREVRARETKLFWEKRGIK